jgi:hypothetical protein
LAPEDERDICEISILPDGRVCVFGASREVIEALAVLNPDDLPLRERIERFRAPERTAAVDRGRPGVVVLLNAGSPGCADERDPSDE